MSPNSTIFLWNSKKAYFCAPAAFDFDIHVAILAIGAGAAFVCNLKGCCLSTPQPREPEIRKEA